MEDEFDPSPDVHPTPQSLTHAMAMRFGMTLAEFVEMAGGGWHPVFSTSLDEDFPMRWYGAGEPLQVLLAMPLGSIIVAAPEETLPGLAGPGGLRAVDRFSIDTDDPDGREALREAIDSILARSRADMAWCQACREFKNAYPVRGFEGRYCVGCQEQYLWIIGC